MTTFVLSGAVTSTRAIAHLRVEAWDAAGICTDLIDVALTDARGQFELRLDADYLSALLPQRAPELVFHVFEGAKPLSQKPAVSWRVVAQATRLQVPIAAVDDPASARQLPAQAVVRGTVRNGDGSPAAGRLVHAIDRNLAGAGFAGTALGQATTGADGQYE